MKKFFVTGTDTDAGKTVVATGLLAALRQQGARTVVLKPVSAGCAATPDGLRNEDVLALAREATIKQEYDQMNPYAFALPSSPHIAADKISQAVNLMEVHAACQPACDVDADYLIVEGAGGWYVPINNRDTMADLARELGAAVILVVGMRLGCFNHALLTAKAIQRDGLKLAGWVANILDPAMLCQAEYIASLQDYINAPLLGVVPHLQTISAQEIARHLNVTPLKDFSIHA